MTIREYECDLKHRWIAWKPHEEGKDNCPVCAGKLEDLRDMERIVKERQEAEMLKYVQDNKVILQMPVYSALDKQPVWV